MPRPSPEFAIPPPRWIKLPIYAVVAFALATLGFGVCGLQQALEECADFDRWEFFYRLLLLFTPDGANLQITPECRFPWEMAVARTTGFFTALAAVVQLLGTTVHKWWRIVRIRCFSKHVTVIGFTAEALAAADIFRDEGRDVVAVGPALEDGHRDRCFFAGVPVVYAPFSERDSLWKQSQACRAERIFVDLPSDAETMELARSIDGPTKFVHIRDCALAARLGDYEFGDKTRIVNIAAMTARDAVARYPLCAWADRLAHDRVHAVLVGYSDVAEALIRSIGTLCHAPRLGPPRISVMDANPDAAKERFRSRYPHVRPEHAEVSFEDDAIKALLDPDRPITVIIVTTESDEENLSRSVTLQQRLARERGAAPPVLVHFRERSLPVSGGELFGEPLRTLGPLREILAASEVADGDGDRIARLIHDRYVASQGGFSLTEAGRREWPQLAETFRDANRRPADHIAVKLAASGFHLDLQDLPLTLMPRVSFTPAGAELEELARAEHGAWAAERAFNGWRQGTRDNAARLHPSLVPYDDLSEGEKQKDRDQIQGLAAQWANGDGTRLLREWRIGIAGPLGNRKPAILEAIARAPEGQRITLVTDSFDTWNVLVDLVQGGVFLLTKSNLRVAAQCGPKLDAAVPLWLGQSLALGRPVQTPADYIARRCHAKFV